MLTKRVRTSPMLLLLLLLLPILLLLLSILLLLLLPFLVMDSLSAVGAIMNVLATSEAVLPRRVVRRTCKMLPPFLMFSEILLASTPTAVAIARYCEGSMPKMAAPK